MHPAHRAAIAAFALVAATPARAQLRDVHQHAAPRAASFQLAPLDQALTPDVRRALKEELAARDARLLAVFDGAWAVVQTRDENVDLSSVLARAGDQVRPGSRSVYEAAFAGLVEAVTTPSKPGPLDGLELGECDDGPPRVSRDVEVDLRFPSEPITNHGSFLDALLEQGFGGDLEDLWPDLLMPVAGGSGECTARAMGDPDWSWAWSDFSQNDHERARDVLDWGRYGPHVQHWAARERGKGLLSGYAAGEQLLIQVFPAGADDWQDPAAYFDVQTDALIAATRWAREDVHPSSYVHAPVFYVELLEVDASGVAASPRLADSLIQTSLPSGPMNYDYEDAIFDALEARYGGPDWQAFRAANGARCDDAEERFNCLGHWIRWDTGVDFLHVQYLIESLDDRRVEGRHQRVGGRSSGGRPWSVLAVEGNGDPAGYDPTSYLSRRNREVMAHELGHDFDIKDEYNADRYCCGMKVGYLGSPHRNNVDDMGLTIDGQQPCTGSQIAACDDQACMYRPGGDDAICPWTLGEAGIRDADRISAGSSDPDRDATDHASPGGDCVFDPHDSTPAALLRNHPLRAVVIERWLDAADRSSRVGVTSILEPMVFAGPTRRADAEAWLEDEGLVGSPSVASVHDLQYFPGYAWDCGVPREFDLRTLDYRRWSEEGRWAMTINEIADLEVRYLGDPDHGSLDPLLDGGLHSIPFENAITPPGMGYSFQPFGLAITIPATLIPILPTGDTWGFDADGNVVVIEGESAGWTIQWADVPDLSSLDFDVRVVADSGNDSAGGTVLSPEQLQDCAVGE